MSSSAQALQAPSTSFAPAADPVFRADVLACFRSTRRAIPARWLYDLAGSELFEAITDLPEYYPTRTETALLERYCGEVAAHGGAGRAVVEFGSGSSVKTPHLLRAVQGEHYVPIDISGEFLRDSASALAADFLICRCTRWRAISCARSDCQRRLRPCPSWVSFPDRPSAT